MVENCPIPKIDVYVIVSYWDNYYKPMNGFLEPPAVVQLHFITLVFCDFNTVVNFSGDGKHNTGLSFSVRDKTKVVEFLFRGVISKWFKITWEGQNHRC